MACRLPVPSRGRLGPISDAIRRPVTEEDARDPGELAVQSPVRDDAGRDPRDQRDRGRARPCGSCRTRSTEASCTRARTGFQPAQVSPEVRARTWSATARASAFAMTGYRIGYVAAAATVAKRSRALHSQLTGCPERDLAGCFRGRAAQRAARGGVDGQGVRQAAAACWSKA